MDPISDIKNACTKNGSVNVVSKCPAPISHRIRAKGEHQPTAGSMLWQTSGSQRQLVRLYSGVCQ